MEILATQINETLQANNIENFFVIVDNRTLKWKYKGSTGDLYNLSRSKALNHIKDESREAYNKISFILGLN